MEIRNQKFSEFDLCDIIILGLLPSRQTAHNQRVDSVEGETDNYDHDEWN